MIFSDEQMRSACEAVALAATKHIRNICKVDCAMPMPMFYGLPVQVSGLCVTHVTVTKRWRRANRPDKVRVRSFEVPQAYLIGPPLVATPTILCHSKIADKLEDYFHAKKAKVNK